MAAGAFGPPAGGLRIVPPGFRFLRTFQVPTRQNLSLLSVEHQAEPKLDGGRRSAINKLKPEVTKL